MHGETGKFLPAIYSAPHWEGYIGWSLSFSAGA